VQHDLAFGVYANLGLHFNNKILLLFASVWATDIFSSSLLWTFSLFYVLGLFDTPKRFGKLKDITRFDASFFGITPKQANRLDPQIRLLLEVTYEAIVDAG